MSILIRANGSFLPTRVVTNDDLSKIMDTSDEWIRERTGIVERHISDGPTTSEMAIVAAKRAVDKFKLINKDFDAKDIGLVIVSTVSEDSKTPGVSNLVQWKLNINNAMAFDLNAACCGFIYAATTARAIMESMNIRYALIIGAESLSRHTNFADRSGAILFGDGAGAVILERDSDEGYGIIDCHASSDGSLSQYLTIGVEKNKNPFYNRENSIDREFMDDDITALIDAPQCIKMDGREVFKFATRKIHESVRDVLDRNNIDIDRIKYIVPHQANKRIIEYSAKRLGISEEIFYMNIDRVGNTSSASIPIALDEMYGKDMLKRDDYVVFTGFGGGMTWGSILVRIS